MRKMAFAVLVVFLVVVVTWAVVWRPKTGKLQEVRPAKIEEVKRVPPPVTPVHVDVPQPEPAVIPLYAVSAGAVTGVVNVTPSADGTLVLHLKEAGRVNLPFVKEEDVTAAQGTVIAVPPKLPKTPGCVELNFNLPKAGIYSIWIRAFWSTDQEDACSNSVQFQIGKAKPVMATDATYRVWHWVQVRYQNREHPNAVELEAGTNKIVLANREKGYKLDQIFITPWNKDEMQRRVPQGIE